MFVNAGNNFSYKLSASVSENDTNIPREGLGTPPEYPFYLTINNNRENMEIVKVVDDGDYPFTFKVDRAQEGTTAQSHEAGSLVENNFTAGTYQALVDEIKALKQQSGIAEIGENENGSYIRYENGIQMCWHVEEYEDIDMTDESGSIYRSIGLSWDYPKPFIDDNVVVSFSSSNSQIWIDSSGNGDSTRVPYRAFSGTSNRSRDFIVRTFAIGQWK